MPIVFEKEVNPFVTAAVWHISEPLMEIFPLMHSMDQKDVKEIFVEKKKLETVATRLTLQHLSEKLGVAYDGINKDEYGKPYLTHQTGIHISISHAFPYAAGIIDRTGPTGIDIEAPREQIHRIRHKFLSPTELAGDVDIDLNQLTVIWCAKETLYKIHGRKSLIFSRHLRIESVNERLLKGYIAINNEENSYDLVAQKLRDHWLVYKSRCIS